MTDDRAPVAGPPKPTAKPGSLVAILGVLAAGTLFVAVPREESGRTVAADVKPTGEVTLRHIAGKQYLHAYRDVVGIWTGCDGIAYVKPGATFTEAQCTALLEQQLVEKATAVMGCTPGLRPEGHDNQRAAATLLAYNIGTGGYCRSSIARRFNAGQYRAACDGFLAWNKAGGRVIKGLDGRRHRERTMCLKDVRP